MNALRLPVAFAAMVSFTGIILTSPAQSAALGITKTSAIVSDPLNDTLPLRIPGSVVDYTVTISNPVANATTTVTGVAFSDAIPDKTMLQLTDIGLTGSGPVQFVDGGILGLLGSNLTYTYGYLSSTGDSLDFSSDNGVSWTYVPVPDSTGCDANVTNIRVRLSGNQAAGSAFALHFRVRVK